MRSLHFVRAIGRGAVGTVYLADYKTPVGSADGPESDEAVPGRLGRGGFSRSVAVKVLIGDGPQQDVFVSRIRDEARLLGLLSDDSVLQVLDMVKVDGRDAVVMEYIEGADLETMIEARAAGIDAPPPKALAELGADVAGALHRAHVALHPRDGTPLGVVHRDVKPANIMVTGGGRIKLLDFGVARARFESRESFTGQMVLGTLNYMAPEYIVTGEVSTRADIYGLALSLWEAAAGNPYGQPKVRRDSHEQRLEERMAQIAGTHGALVPLLRRMLAWEAELRPAGDQVEIELRALAQQLTVDGPAVGLQTWAREHVPTILAKRTAVEDSARLVGRVFEVKGELDDPVSADEGPPTLDLMDQTQGVTAPAPASERTVPAVPLGTRTLVPESRTLPDTSAPAPAPGMETTLKRAPSQPVPSPLATPHVHRVPREGTEPKVSERRAKKKRRSRSQQAPSPIWFIFQGLLLGGAVGFLVVLFMVGLLILRGSMPT